MENNYEKMCAAFTCFQKIYYILLLLTKEAYASARIIIKYLIYRIATHNNETKRLKEIKKEKKMEEEK